MRQIPVIARVALWSFAAIGVAGIGSAQRSGGENRPGTTTIRTEQELKFSIELDAPPTLQCEVVTESSYHQRDTVARVESTIKTDDCPAAAGEFKVSVRVKDASGEVKALEFDGTWQRSDAADVALTNDYPIGDDAELVSARVRGVTCKCAAAVVPAQE